MKKRLMPDEPRRCDTCDYGEAPGIETKGGFWMCLNCITKRLSDIDWTTRCLKCERGEH
jgi:hypothetical protein